MSELTNSDSILVSVIVAVYNCKEFVQQSIGSILKQTHTNLEILVCDDCSTDGTWEELLKFTDLRISLFRNERNIGVVGCRNKMLSIASGDFILIQDADDWAASERVKSQLSILLSKDLHVCVTSHFRVNSIGKTEVHGAPNASLVTLQNIDTLNFMPATLMLRYAVYQKLGGYNDFFSRLYGEDLYWICRMISCFRVYYLNEPLYYYRFNSHSITNSLVDDRQLVTSNVMGELIRQRASRGSDWVEEGNINAVEKFISSCYGNRTLMAEKYRVAAAVQRDCNDRLKALRLIARALFNEPLRVKNYRTLKYIIWP